MEDNRPRCFWKVISAVLLALILREAYNVPHGGRDWADVGADEVVYGLDDMAELAARLWSPDTFNREGNVLFMEGFEHGLQRWQLSESGTGAEVIISAARYRSGGYSCKIAGPSEGAGFAKIFRKQPYPVLCRYGFEFSVLIWDGTQDLLWTLAYHDGTNEHNFTLKYMAEEEEVWIKGSDGSYSVLITGLELSYTYSDFQTIKLVADFPNDVFHRLIINESEYDLSAYPAFIFASDDSPNVRIDLQQRNLTDQAAYSYVDDVILTQNEPPCGIPHGNPPKGGAPVKEFWNLVKSSTIIQGLVTLAFVGTTCYLYATGQDVPDSLIQLDGLAVGFFFGAKIQQLANR